MRRQLESNNFNMLVSEFRSWLKVNKKSESCVTHYPQALEEYFEYLETVHNIKHINKVDKKHSTMFKIHLQNRLNKKVKIGCIHNQTVNCIIKALNKFTVFMAECSSVYKYAITEKYLPVEHSEKIILTEAEIKELFNATYEAYPNVHGQQAFGQRDRVILHLLYSCGLRSNEASSLDLSDIMFSSNKILVRNGKGNKQRYVPVTQPVMDEIRNYVENGRYYFTEKHANPSCRKRIQKKEQTASDRQALLLGVEGKRLFSLYRRLHYLKPKTSISKDVTCHVLRHSYGTHLYQNGMKLDRVQLMLGHASQDTTMIYVHIAERLKELEEFNTDYNEAV